MQNNILFDNIYVGHSEKDANRIAESTWKLKHEKQIAEEKEKEKLEEKEVIL